MGQLTTIARRKLAGLCVDCGSIKSTAFLRCGPCAMKQSQRVRDNAARKRAAGLKRTWA